MAPSRVCSLTHRLSLGLLALGEASGHAREDPQAAYGDLWPTAP